jgi:serine/threonine-protein kinase
MGITRNGVSKATAPEVHPMTTVDPMIGERVAAGTILLQKKLGAGGMGTVYLGRDEKRDRLVAVKVLRGDIGSRESIERFKSEGQRFGALRHENLVRVLGFGREKRRTFIISEFIEGRNLYEVLFAEGPFPVEEALRVVRDAASGLHEAHRSNVIHRDLKPENIMIRAADNVVKVLDFGLAKDLAASIALTKFVPGNYFGTPGYSAPEQVKGLEIDHRADVFSLGVILYELLTGKVAFEGRETSEVLKATVRKAPVAPDTLNEMVTLPVAQLINRMIQKSPRHRPADMLEVISEIDCVKGALARGFEKDEKRGVRDWLVKFFQG